MDIEDLVNEIRRTGPVMAAERIEHAESALAAAQSRIEDLLAARAMDDAQFAKDRKRIAELERMVVWAVESSGFAQLDSMNGRLWLGRSKSIDCDGTPASILAAVEKAMGGK